MIWPAPPDDYPYDDAFRHRPSYREERLRHVVFLDGLLIDTWTERVEGTAYWDRAQELDRAARRRSSPPDPPPIPPHERVLEWLDSVVGGRAALLELHVRPLEQVEAVDDADERYADVVAALDQVCRSLFDDEFRCAAHAALASLWRVDRGVLTGSPAEVAGGLCWMVGRANGCVGAGSSVTQQVLRRELWLKSSLTPRATRFRGRLRDLLPSPSHRPPSCPDLLEVGNPAYLTGATRRDLVQLRDRALEAAAVAVADQEARQVVLPTKVE